MINLKIPISKEEIRKLRCGDIVSISGKIITARDTAHKYIVDNLLVEKRKKEDEDLYNFLKENLSNSIIYHCGPIIKQENGKINILSAGPTTSIREEPYEHKLIEAFQISGIIGKGGMGNQTLQALNRHSCVYLQAVGGAAVFYADKIKSVLDVRKREFGTPEAIYLMEIENFECIVSMDSAKNSLHEKIKEQSETKLHNEIFL